MMMITTTTTTTTTTIVYGIKRGRRNHSFYFSDRVLIHTLSLMRRKVNIDEG